LRDPARREAMTRRIDELGITNGVGEAVAALRSLARRGAATVDGTATACSESRVPSGSAAGQ